MPELRPRDLFDEVVVCQTKEAVRFVQEPDVSLEIAHNRVHPSARHAADGHETPVVEVTNRPGCRKPNSTVLILEQRSSRGLVRSGAVGPVAGRLWHCSRDRL